MFPKIGERFWADAKNNEDSLRLFSAMTVFGWVGAVFDFNANRWEARKWANDAEDGKRKAEAAATAILKTLPPIEWKKSPSS